MGILINDTPQDVTPSQDASGHMRLDFADGTAIWWDEAAQTFMSSVRTDPLNPAG